MLSNLKALGLAMIAVLAISGAVTSAVQAQFRATAYPTTITGTSPLGNSKLATEGGSVECIEHVEGTVTEASPAQALTPLYTDCRAFGFASAEVNMNGCDYLLHHNGRIDLRCTGGSTVVVTAGNCVVQINEQTALNSVELDNNRNHINAKADVGGIKYNVTKDGFLCPFIGTGAKTGASFTHNSPITLESVSSGTDIAVGALSSMFTANSYPVEFTAASQAGNEQFVFGSIGMECKGHYEGSYVEASTAVAIDPSYTECTGLGSLTMAIVNMNGCSYMSYANGDFDLACPLGKQIVMSAGNCEVQIPAQVGLESIELTNDGAHIESEAYISEITYSVTKDGFSCSFSGTGLKEYGAALIQADPVTIEPVSGGTDITLD